MKGFETPEPANDNNDIYAKFEIASNEWEAQCEAVSSLARELAALADEAQLETGGKAQVIRSMEMIQLALALKDALSEPHTPVNLTGQAD